MNAIGAASASIQRDIITFNCGIRIIPNRKLTANARNSGNRPCTKSTRIIEAEYLDIVRIAAADGVIIAGKCPARASSAVDSCIGQICRDVSTCYS